MGIGIYINIKVYNVKKLGEPCAVTDENVLLSFLMYGSYFMFFCHFFYLAYLKKTTKKLSSNGKPSSSQMSKAKSKCQ